MAEASKKIEDDDVKTEVGLESKSDTIEKANTDVNSEDCSLKPFCQCSSCYHWNTSVDWSKTDQVEFKKPIQQNIVKMKPSPLLKTINDFSEEPDIYSYNPKVDVTKVQKQSACKILIHGSSIPHPIKLIADNNFHEQVKKVLKDLGYVRCIDIQSVIWPILFRQLNVFMISGSGTGKTMAYITAIASFIKSDYTQFAKYKGPLVIIICPNSKISEKVFDLIIRVMPELPSKRKIILMTYPFSNVSNIDILVTIPGVLLECVKMRMFNFKRLCHIVLDNANILLKNSEKDIYTILKLANDMLNHRTDPKSIQLIVSSERWTSDLEALLKSVYLTPTVCIAHELEAALYGNTKFHVKFIKADRKRNNLAEILNDTWNIRKTVVICENDEILKIYLYLVKKGIGSIYINNDTGKEDIYVKENNWREAPYGKYKVLLCTDFAFSALLDINDAMSLIHYSFPATWTRFVKRFSAFSSLLKSPLLSSQIDVQCYTFIIIDESCEDQLEKILSLSRRIIDLPDSYKLYIQGFKLEKEINKVKNKVKLCSDLKLFGKCSLHSCESRHNLDEDVDMSNNIPKSGEVNFKIIEILDVTHYIIQITQHIDINDQIHRFDNHRCYQVLPYNTNALKLSEDVKENEIYCYRELESNSNKSYLCRVTRILSETKVEIKLFATNKITSVSKIKLYEPPSNLQIAYMYLSHLLPPFNDACFSANSFKLICIKLEQLEYRNILLSGQIVLQLDKTLWLDNVEQKIKTYGSNVVKFNLSKHLQEIKLVEKNMSQMSLLHQLCRKYGVTLPQNVKLRKKSVEEKLPKIQEAFLSEDCIEEVYISNAVSPSEIYVRLVKFNNLLENLEYEINASVNLVACPKEEVCAGKYYLVPTPKGHQYARALVLRIVADRVMCYYVDYGDEAVQRVSNFFKIPDKFLTQLPFQAIQCKLYGISSRTIVWDDTATDILYRYMFEPYSEYFRIFFTKTCFKEVAAARTSSLYSIILKDSLGDQILINQLLVNRELANSTQVLEDFDMFQQSTADNLSHDSSEEIEEEEEEDEEDEEDFTSDENKEGFQLVVLDKEKFLETWSLSTINVSTPALTHNPQNSDGQKEGLNSTALIKQNNCLTPDIYWSQTKSLIKIKIKLIGVESYNIKVIKKRVFYFSTVNNDKRYEVNFVLNNIVSLDSHCAKGQEVQISLKKIKLIEWFRLNAGPKRLRYIHYEFNESEENIPRKKFLDLNISDEKTSEESDNLMYTVVSEMDSDFDQEFDSPSS